MAEGTLFQAVVEGDLEQVKTLLASGIKPDPPESKQTHVTPLMAAAVDHHTDIAIALIRAKANINTKDNDNRAPLWFAAFHGNTDTVIALVEAKSNIDVRDYANRTPLMWAAQNDYTDIVITLLKAKASINAKDEDGNDVMWLAKNKNNSDIVSVLEQARDDFEGFLWSLMTEEEKNNTCRREYGRAFALASRVTKFSNFEDTAMEKVQKRLPPDYRDVIQFFSRNPGLVKWTGTALLLYFNAGSLDVLGSDHHTVETETRSRWAFM